MKVLARSKSSCVNTRLQGVNQSKDGEQKGQLSMGAHTCKWDETKCQHKELNCKQDVSVSGQCARSASFQHSSAKFQFTTSLMNRQCGTYSMIITITGALVVISV